METTSAMKVAIVHDWLTGMRGGEKCLEIFCRLFPDADLYTLLHARGSTSPTIERMRIHTSFLQKLPLIERYYRYALPLMPRAIEAIELPRDVDLVISSSHAVAKGVRSPSGVPHICYCYTPMRYAWHLRESYFGAGPKRRRLNPLHMLRDRLLDSIRQWDRATHERVTQFIAISRTTARRIAECYGRQSDVIYPPVDTNFYTPADTAREDYYLCVSALAPYKRLDLAIEACRRSDRRLAIIGPGPELKRLKAAARGARVQFLGWQGDVEIREHFRRAKALLFPGHEDFGIVPLEAQACGLPVIAYARGGATETVIAPQGPMPGSGIFFHEQTADALASAIAAFAEHTDRTCPRVARLNAEQFSMERFVAEIRDAFMAPLAPVHRAAA